MRANVQRGGPRTVARGRVGLGRSVQRVWSTFPTYGQLDQWRSAPPRESEVYMAH